MGEVENAKRKIIRHLKKHPELHRTPEHLVNSYSGMGGHPIRYCKQCRELIDKYKIGNIKRIKVDMWGCHYEGAKSKGVVGV